MLRKNTWLLLFISDKAPACARSGYEVARVLNARHYPHTGSSGLSWVLSVGRRRPWMFASPRRHVDVIFLPPHENTEMRRIP